MIPVLLINVKNWLRSMEIMKYPNTTLCFKKNQSYYFQIFYKYTPISSMKIH